MRNNYLWSVLALLLVFSACRNEKTYTLEGNITNLIDNHLYIVMLADSAVKIDTVQVVEGKFAYRACADSLLPVLIYMEEGSVWMTAWATNRDHIEITGDAVYPELIEVRGNEVNDLLTLFKTENKASIRERRKLIDAKEPEHQNRINHLDSLLKEKAQTFIQEHPASIASLVLIQDYVVDNRNWDNVGHYLSLLDNNVKNNKLFHKLQTVVEKQQRTSIGNKAPDFTLITTEQDTLSLDKFQGRYLLLTFDNAEYAILDDLIKLRKKLPKKQLAIVTVSLDENPANWAEVTKNKKIDWHQVTDQQGWASEIRLAYNVNNVPENFLIDKEGIIFAKNITIENLTELITKNSN
jgi:peroxiredoxin